MSSVLLSPALAPAILALLGSFAFYHCYKCIQKGQEKSLKNELILITGGCGGIGRQIVKDLSLRKARVLIIDIQKPCFTLPESVDFYQVDITSTRAVAEFATLIQETHGDPTVLINNAGVFYHGTILETTEEKIRRTFDVNVVSQFILAKEFIPAMVRNNRGHLITVASIASFVSVGEMVDYCCSKASALAFHEGLTQELKHFYNAPNVLTSIIHPLWVDTPMIKGFTTHQSAFRQPLMAPNIVSERVVEQIAAQKRGQIILPKMLWISSLLRGMPIWLQEVTRSFFSKIVYRVRKVRTASK